MSVKDYEITVTKAVEWTTLWRVACPNNCKAFLIPIEDLMGVLEEMKVLTPVDGEKNTFKYKEGHNNDIRAYMAIDPKFGQSGASPEEKVLLVGTEKEKKDGKTIYRDIIKGKYDPCNLSDGDDGPQSGVFDFTEPCPNLCDDESPLNGGG